jgi:hypothetical protein
MLLISISRNRIKKNVKVFSLILSSKNQKTMNSKRIKNLFQVIFFLVFLLPFNTLAQQNYDLIIIGGGASGTAAGITAGRLGLKTLIIEETTWLGGMLTSAGVSAIDGNHQISGGIYGEFKKALENHYGSAEALATGWVSHTLFEPSVGNQILQRMVAQESNVEVYFQSFWKSASFEKGNWRVFFMKNSQNVEVTSRLLIDATELGDVAASQGLPYRLGMDARDVIGEEFAPLSANSIIQDLTYVVTLQDYGQGVDKTIPKPADYDPSEFECACAHADPTTDFAPTLDCAKMLTYGKLPNGKYMVNWPNCGNDYYLNIIELSPQERLKALEAAKAVSLRFVYFIQHELGFKNLGLAEDEYPTEDDLPMIPYHRESRRYYGLIDFTLPHVLNPYETPNPLYRTGVVTGDYTIDHHHKKNLDAPSIDFIKIRVPSYSIPLGALIPKNHSGLILAEKSISVSNIVNGATRLQPVVLGIGQAAGTLAAVAVRANKAPSEVSIRQIQKEMLQQGAYLMPFLDVKNTEPYFAQVQKIGLTGILKGVGVPYLWANQTWFYPERLVTEYELVDGLRSIYPELKEFWGASGANLTAERFVKIVQMIRPDLSEENISKVKTSSRFEGLFTDGDYLNRLQVSILLDEILDPFSKEIDWIGELK